MHPGDPSHLLGKVIDGRYEILQCIGEGGMGVVYKARQTSIDRMVAVKMLSSNLAKDRSWVQRFYNEAKACSRLHHPNTIRMFDFGQTRDGHLFMAMEFLDGLSLRQVITEQAPMDPQRVLKIVIGCCASLSEAHNLGIIHRDIKADNVFLIDLPGSRDHVKLLDFGVAKLMMAEDFATQVGVVFGTPQYMSPEQGRGEPLTPRSDLYGVGILAYEMLTGAVPFTDQVPMTVLQMQMQSAVPPLPPRVPAAVQQLVMLALEKDPSRRFATAAAMMEAAQAILTALQTGPFARASGPGPVAERTASPYPSGPSGPPPAVSAPRTLPGPLGQTVVPGLGSRPGPAVPPPGFGGPPPGMQVGANMPTVLDRPNPLLAAGRGGASAAASARTMMVSTPGESTQPSGPPVGGPGGSPSGRPGGSPIGPGGSGSPGRPGAYPSGGSPELRTMMIANTEGVVSMSREGPAPRHGESGGGPAVSYPQPFAYPPPAPRANASALFWILCLVTGLAVGIGAYWLVLELGT